MLPHHGSKHNLKSGFIHDHERVIWVAAYGTRNRFGHPDPHLMGLANALGYAVPVTEKRQTEFTQSALIEW
jgi:beta-lactamase superfamily II metal-dependent hydrolase